jgi:hypothetical protein
MDYIIILSGKEQWTVHAIDLWSMDRYEQQEQVRQDEGINLILIK